MPSLTLTFFSLLTKHSITLNLSVFVIIIGVVNSYPYSLILAISNSNNLSPTLTSCPTVVKWL